MFHVVTQVSQLTLGCSVLVLRQELKSQAYFWIFKVCMMCPYVCRRATVRQNTTLSSWQDYATFS